MGAADEKQSRPQRPVRARSSVGQSIGFRYRRPGVRILPSAHLHLASQRLQPSILQRERRFLLAERDPLSNDRPSYRGVGPPRQRRSFFPPSVPRFGPTRPLTAGLHPRARSFWAHGPFNGSIAACVVGDLPTTALPTEPTSSASGLGCAYTRTRYTTRVPSPTLDWTSTSARIKSARYEIIRRPHASCLSAAGSNSRPSSSTTNCSHSPARPP